MSIRLPARFRARLLTMLSAVVIAAALNMGTTAVSKDSRALAAPPGTEAPNCATGVDFLGFSDALNKQSFDGTKVGGLSALAYDKRREVYYSLVDNGPEDSSTLANPALEPVNKELLVDLADCPSGGATTPGTQENPLLDNYESLEIGSRLPGGRRTLLLQSDDNFNDVQVTRLVALGARLQPNR